MAKPGSKRRRPVRNSSKKIGEGNTTGSPVPPSRIETKLRKKKDKDATEQDIEVEGTVDDGSERKKRKKQSKKPASIGFAGKTVVTAEVDEALGHFINAALEKGVEGLRKEFADITPAANTESTARTDVSASHDASRVKLTLNVPPESEFINANWVKMEGVDRSFIATHAPHDAAIPDFWRMVYQENVATILSLTEEEAKGKHYWPLEHNDYKTYGCMFINNKKVEKEEKCSVFTLEVLPEGCSNSNIVKLVQISDWWPDRDVPLSGNGLLRMLKLVSSDGPCVIHCSDGTGRTGTALAVETVIQRLFKATHTNVKDVVLQLRHQRPNAVHTDAQYVFIHICVMRYITAKMKKYVDAVVPFNKAFKKLS
ncbi:hypothetical protein L596_016704 [Steinernema carpocapsae]|uniref:Tyrosine-protein phosphatase domain-containing protein n=1 Tax=Steinernema carpocapsae TaxID=34508 RepID=A0A4U5NK36_STECR|nr:hypothetical protein L596_016704 [Steinernema carpocapsae]